MTSTFEKKCFRLQREAKKMDTLWKVNSTNTITYKKTRETCAFFSLSPSFFLCPLSVCDVVLCVGVHVVSVVWAVVWCVFGAPRRVGSRTTRSRFLQAFALPDENCSTPALMKKIQKKKQPLDGSICLSPQEIEFNEQFARQCRNKPPPEFSLTGKVHVVAVSQAHSPAFVLDQ